MTAPLTLLAVAMMLMVLGPLIVGGLAKRLIVYVLGTLFVLVIVGR